MTTANSFDDIRSTVINRMKYILDGRTIVVMCDELVDYHRGEYDWEEKDRIVFETPLGAKKMFDLILEAERQGEINMQRDMSRKIEESLKSVIGTFK